MSGPGELAPARLPARSDESALPELAELLNESDGGAREEAWERLMSRHSRLLLHIAGLVMPDHDGVMDAYTHVLEQLRREDFRILRSYTHAETCQFSTWLAVVARRTCIDFYRQRYGRPRGDNGSTRVTMERAARQRLMDLVGVSVDLTQIVDHPANNPEAVLRNEQLQDSLSRALAALPASDRLLIKLRFDDELSAQDIAPILDLPTPFHVYRRIKAVCAELRAQLAARGIDGSTP